MIKRLWGRFSRIDRAVWSLICNLVLGFYNGALGLLGGGVWFGFLCVYYLLLGVMRLVAVSIREKQRAVQGVCGVLLALLSLVLTGILCISLRENRAAVYGEIPMIAIAAYTFAKLTMAAVQAAKSRGGRQPEGKTVRTIRYAEVAVSVFTLQRSMLVSFGEMPGNTVFIFNASTGGTVCFFTLLLGIVLLTGQGRREKCGKVENCGCKP